MTVLNPFFGYIIIHSYFKVSQIIKSCLVQYEKLSTTESQNMTSLRKKVSTVERITVDEVEQIRKASKKYNVKLINMVMTDKCESKKGISCPETYCEQQEQLQLHFVQ